MTDVQEAILVILSGALAVFLLLAVIAAVKIIQILHHLKAISEKAEHIADSAETIGEFFKQGAKSMSIAKLLSNIHDTVFNNSKGKKSK